MSRVLIPMGNIVSRARSCDIDDRAAPGDVPIICRSRNENTRRRPTN